MLTCDIFNLLNLTLLLYFKRYCKLNFKNKAIFCVQICHIFAGLVTNSSFIIT